MKNYQKKAKYILRIILIKHNRHVSILKENGYGFITPISYTYKTILFHCSQFKSNFRKLKINDKVSFELVDDKCLEINVNLYTGDNTSKK